MEPERMLAILESKDRMKAGRTAPCLWPLFGKS